MIKGVKEGEGFESRYSDRRARVSISINNVSEPTNVKTYLRGHYPGHLDMCTRAQTDSQLVASGHGLALVYCSLILWILILGSRAAFLLSRLDNTVSILPYRGHAVSAPRTNKLFSGSRFPLEMLSSIGFQISSFSASLLPGLSWPPGTLVGKPDARRALIAEVVRISRGTR